jgi:hypothetical protein
MIGRTAALLLVCLSVARADAPPDIIELHDGTFLQGRLTEWKPGARAIIVLLNGESRTVDWTMIAHTSGPSFEHIHDGDFDLEPTVIIPPLVTQPAFPPPPPPPVVIPAFSRPALAMADPRRRKGFLLTIASCGPLIAGAVYTAVGASEDGRNMQTFRDTYIGLGSALLIGATATLVGGIVLLSTRKHNDKVALTLSPGGLSRKF